MGYNSFAPHNDQKGDIQIRSARVARSGQTKTAVQVLKFSPISATLFSPPDNKIILLLLALLLLAGGVGCSSGQSISPASAHSIAFVTVTPGPNGLAGSYVQPTLARIGNPTVISIQAQNPSSALNSVGKPTALFVSADSPQQQQVDQIALVEPSSPNPQPDPSSPAFTPTPSPTALPPQQSTPTPAPAPTNTLPPPATATPIPSAGTTVSLESITIQPPNCAVNPTTAVRIDKAAELQGLAFKIHFDPAKLHVVDANAEQDGIQIGLGQAFRSQMHFVAVNRVDQAAGVIDFGAVLIGEQTINGAAVLAEITWEVRQVGMTNLSLHDVELAGPGGARLGADIRDGVIDVSAGCQ